MSNFNLLVQFQIACRFLLVLTLPPHFVGVFLLLTPIEPSSSGPSPWPIPPGPGQGVWGATHSHFTSHLFCCLCMYVFDLNWLGKQPVCYYIVVCKSSFCCKWKANTLNNALEPWKQSSNEPNELWYPIKVFGFWQLPKISYIHPFPQFQSNVNPREQIYKWYNK